MSEARTGSRIRTRRLEKRMKQAELARAAGISASYLNLIEHNRRRIGGALLTRLAEALGVAPDLLAQGAEAALIERLEAAASAADDAQPELARSEEFSGQFPGWAALVAEQATRIAALDHALTRLGDRMTHDPHLAASMHDLVSIITSIRSSASILAETGDLSPEWRARFDRNIHEDSRRLSEAGAQLVAYLDAAGEATQDPVLSPIDEMVRAFEAAGPHIPELEQDGSPEAALHRIGQDLGPAAAALALRWLRQMQRDAERLPLTQLGPALAQHGPDPGALSEELDLPADVLLRRLAHLPPDMVPEPLGLVICDAAGALIYRRELPDFPVPHYDAACALWPLFEALSRPGVPIARDVATAGREARAFRTYSVASPAGRARYGGAARVEAVMLIRSHPDPGAEPARKVGPTCRICAHQPCAARRVDPLVAPGTT